MAFFQLMVQLIEYQRYSSGDDEVFEIVFSVPSVASDEMKFTLVPYQKCLTGENILLTFLCRSCVSRLSALL